MAEQMALIDNISRGRLLVGLGRGTAYNVYDYQGYGIDPAEAQDRLDEAEEVMIKAWTTENYEHRGKFWSLRLPLLRPRPYTRPHPPIIRACASEEAVVSMARAGRPFLMNVQSNEITRQRMLRYRETMRDSGFDEATIAKNVAATWVWRNIFVAETDAEAERLALPAFQTQADFRQVMRRRIYEEQGVLLKPEIAPAARNEPRHALLCGSPATVAEAIAEIDRIGVGGLILVFRIGPMPYEDRRKQHPALHAEGRPGVSRPAGLTRRSLLPGRTYGAASRPRRSARGLQRGRPGGHGADLAQHAKDPRRCAEIVPSHIGQLGHGQRLDRRLEHRP